MPAATSRLSLAQPLGTDTPAELREAITGNATILDAAAMFQTGTLSARPAANTVVAGTFYRSTDTDDLAISDGTSWYSLERQANRGADSGYAELDSSGYVPLTELVHITAEIGADSGIASLDSSGHVPLTELSGITGSQLAASAGITNSQLAAGAGRLNYRSLTANGTAASGDWIEADAAGITITLPAATTANQIIAVTAGAATTGASPITISSVSNINGVGLSGDSFVLGTPQATVWLQSSGTNWRIISGQRDTGWVAISTLAPSPNLGVEYGSSPSVRLIGDRVYMKGSYVISGDITTAWTFPAAMYPPTMVYMPFINNLAAPNCSGALGVSTVGQVGSAATSGLLCLDGLSYSIT